MLSINSVLTKSHCPFCTWFPTLALQIEQEEEGKDIGDNNSDRPSELVYALPSEDVATFINCPPTASCKPVCNDNQHEYFYKSSVVQMNIHTLESPNPRKAHVKLANKFNVCIYIYVCVVLTRS